MSKNKPIDIAILILVYVAVCAIPFSLIIKNIPALEMSLKIAMQILYSIFAFFFVRKQEVEMGKNKFNLMAFLLIIPAILICFSNSITALFMASSFHAGNYSYLMIFEIILTILVVINEEFLFRNILITGLKKFSPLAKIFISAAIFGLVHITHFLSSFNPIDLLVVVYTFGLGLVLGIFYVYVRCIYACIGFHLLFNVLNDAIFARFAVVNNWMIYYIVNISIGVLIGVYLLLTYILFFRRTETEEPIEENKAA